MKTNRLNVFLQDEGAALAAREKAVGFQKKLILGGSTFENRCLEIFPTLCDFVAKNDVCCW